MQIDDGTKRFRKAPRRDTNPETFEIDHSTLVSARLERALTTGVMSDITLLVGSQRFPVHRVVLCLASEVFQIMLSSGNFAESRQFEVELHEEPECERAFTAMLRFIYTGRVSLNISVALPLLKLADKYDVKELGDACCDFMCERVVVASMHNMLTQWLMYARSSYHSKLYQCCLDFTKWNLDAVAVSEQFLDLDEDLLRDLLVLDDLVVRDEYTLLRHVTRWIDVRHVDDLSASRLDSPSAEQCHHTSSVSCRICRLLRHIRFGLIAPEQLTEILGWPVAVRHNKLFLRRVSAAILFHSGEWMKTDKSPFNVCCRRLRHPAVNSTSSTSIKNRGGKDGVCCCYCECSQTEPRLYTHDTWSACLTIDNYHALPAFSTRSLVFQSPAHCCAAAVRNRPAVEWTVDVYARGVLFQRARAIGWLFTLEVPEVQLSCVRVTLTPSLSALFSSSAAPITGTGCLRVRTAVLVDATIHGARHVRTVLTRRWVFTCSEPQLSIDNVLSLQELTSGCRTAGNDEDAACSPYLLGSERNILCLRVITVPRSYTSQPPCRCV